jgi:lipid-binding SYLF domain-containing protein
MQSVKIRFARAAGTLVLVLAIGDRLAQAQTQRRQDADAQRINAATAVLSSVTSAEKGIPRAVLDKTEGMAVFPVMPTVTERVGSGPNTRRSARMTAVDARGVLSARDAGGTWSPPAFITVTGESVPERADLVLVVVSKRALDNLMRPDFAINASTAIAPGPISADAQAWTDAQRRAEIFSYVRTGNALDGVALTDGRVQPDPIAHQRVYGDRLLTGAVVALKEAPASTAPWREALQKNVSKR